MESPIDSPVGELRPTAPKIYLAGSEGVEFNHPSIAFKHRLVSYAALSPRLTDRYFSEGPGDLFLDSGAYSAHTKGTPIDLDQYIRFIRENDVALYAALDVIEDEDASVANFRQMRDSGLHSIPIFHQDESERILEEYLGNCDYIALGGMVGSSTINLAMWLDWIFGAYLTRDGSPIVKVHGFGLTSPRLLFRYPWYSVDSTTWLHSSANGMILIPRRDIVTGEFRFDVPWCHLPISECISDQSGHLDMLLPSFRQSVLDHIVSKNFDVEELRTNYLKRYEWNIRFFRDLEDFAANQNIAALAA